MFRPYVNEEGVQTPIWVSQSGICILELYKSRGKVCGGVMGQYMNSKRVSVVHKTAGKIYCVHRLVAATWGEDVINDKSIVAHKDEDIWNNHIDNLFVFERIGEIQEFEDVYKPFFHWRV